MKRLLIILAALTALALTAQVANAEPADPIVRGYLDVSVTGPGKVTGTSINCPGDCSAEESWKESEFPPPNRLTAVETVAGWAFSGWTGCTVVNGQSNKCDATYGEIGSDPVIARFIDVMAPNVRLNSFGPSEEVGDDLYLSAVASDNDRVTRVEYLIDGQVFGVATTGDTWDIRLDTSDVPEGGHQVQIRAFDPAGNNGITVNHAITVDHTGPAVTLKDPVAATSAIAPGFTFTSDSPDFDDASCLIKKAGEDIEVTDWCGKDEEFSAETPEEGNYEFVVQGYDRAYNQTEVTHAFVVDRTAPAIGITAGPANGETVEKGDIEYAWSVTDATATTQECSFDGTATACDGTVVKSLPKGEHTFELKVTDLAGNTSTETRGFTVKVDGTPDPDDRPDPDASDKTAPVIKLATTRQKLKALRKGLKVKVTCSEACAGTVRAKAKGGLKFTGTVNLTTAGRTAVVLKPTASTRKKLKTARKPVRLTVTTRLADPSGNASTFRLRAKVKK